MIRRTNKIGESKEDGWKQVIIIVIDFILFLIEVINLFIMMKRYFKLNISNDKKSN